MDQLELDSLWIAFTADRRNPDGFSCLLRDDGDHIIQSVATGEQWLRKMYSDAWTSGLRSD